MWKKNVLNNKKNQPDMSQNKLWKEKKLILPWIKWIKKKSKHSNKYIFDLTENMAKKSKINCDAILINRLIN
jgi:hypothetical protein